MHLVARGVSTVRTRDLIADVRSGEGPEEGSHALCTRECLCLCPWWCRPMQPCERALPPRGFQHGAGRACVRESARAGRGRRSRAPRARTDRRSWPSLGRALSAVGSFRWSGCENHAGCTRGRGSPIGLCRSATRGCDAHRAAAQQQCSGSLGHVVFIVLRGARADRFIPALSPHLSQGGFARLMVYSCGAAMAVTPRALGALASAATGLPPEVHGMVEFTDVLSDEAPAVGATLHAAGVSTAMFSDDRWLEGLGARPWHERTVFLSGAAATCRADAILPLLADWLVTACPSEPCPRGQSCRDLSARPAAIGWGVLDPRRDENLVTPQQVSQQMSRTRRGLQTFTQAELERYGLLYDASLAGFDRALNVLLDRLRDANLLQDTMIVLVGDRGTALGEWGTLGDGEARQFNTSHTVLMVRAPG